MRYLLLALSLMSCAPTLSNSNEAGGRINQRFSMGNDRAFKLASDNCAKFGKVAVVTQTDVLSHSTLYECRAK